MGTRRGRAGAGDAAAIEAEMEVLRAEMARLRRRESEAAARLAERRRADETALLCLMGRVLLNDLDPDKQPGPSDALHHAAKRDLARRSAWYALRLRAAALDPARRLPALDGLLARLDGQAAQERAAAPAALPMPRPAFDRPPPSGAGVMRGSADAPA